VEEISSPICVKVDEFGMNIYSGNHKFFNIIDFTNDRVEKFQLKSLTKAGREKGSISAFEFHRFSPYYLLGTYSKKIFIMDYKTNCPIQELNFSEGGVNNLKFFNNDNNYFLSGGRMDNSILLFDMRNLASPVFNFYRNNQTNQRTNYSISSCDRYLFTGGMDGTCLIYDLISGKIISYFFTNLEQESISSIDYNSELKLLITSFGCRKYPQEGNEEQVPKNIEQIKSSFIIWDCKEL
jgi:WD40 repeat protein